MQIQSFEHFKKIVRQYKFKYKFVITVTFLINIILIATYIIQASLKGDDPIDEDIFHNKPGVEILAGVMFYSFIAFTFLLHINMNFMFYGLILHFTEIFQIKYKVDMNKIKRCSLLMLCLFILIKSTLVFAYFTFGSYFLFWEHPWVKEFLKDICPWFFQAYEICRYVWTLDMFFKSMLLVL